MSERSENMTEETNKLKEFIGNSNNIVFFGGAGVSTESGIPDFRSEEGIFSAVSEYGYPPEQILSRSFYNSHKNIFFEYYKNNLLFTDAKPNNAHIGLAKLEKEGKLKAVITQNIDNLHQLAGSKNVLELHGTLYRNYCTKCGKEYNMEYVTKYKKVTVCSVCSGVVRPDVVLYEEGLNEETVSRAINYIANADVLIVGGTSLAVYPAAGLIDYYKKDKLVLINQSATGYDKSANLVIRENIGDVFKQVLEPE